MGSRKWNLHKEICPNFGLPIYRTARNKSLQFVGHLVYGAVTAAQTIRYTLSKSNKNSPVFAFFLICSNYFGNLLGHHEIKNQGTSVIYCQRVGFLLTAIKPPCLCNLLITLVLFMILLRPLFLQCGASFLPAWSGQSFRGE